MTSLGALYEHIEDSIDDLLVNQTPATAIRVYSTQNHTAPTYTRNTSCYASSLVGQLTALSPWNSESIYQKGGVLISPRHVLFATHYAPASGSTIRFVATDGTVHTRTISSTSALADIALLYPDLTVALLDSDAPGAISFAKVLGSDAQAKLPTSWAGVPLPAIVADQEEKLTVRNWVSYAWAKGSTDAQCGFMEPAAQPYSQNTILRQPFYEGMVSGDSGSPAFIFINGNLVLLTVISTGGPGTGTSITPFIGDINAAMTALGGGYQLTTVDLSSFPDL